MKGTRDLSGRHAGGAGSTGCAGSGVRKGPKYDTNLLKNGSFEDVGGDGIPKNWKLVLFKGSPDEPEVRGAWTRSRWTASDPSPSRPIRHAALPFPPAGNQGARCDARAHQGMDARRRRGMRRAQAAMCNFLLTYYDKDHNRFQMERQADRRTPLRAGTYPWEEQVYTFPLPEGTRYVAVSCILGSNGQAGSTMSRSRSPGRCRGRRRPRGTTSFTGCPSTPCRRAHPKSSRTVSTWRQAARYQQRRRHQLLLLPGLDYHPAHDRHQGDHVHELGRL